MAIEEFDHLIELSDSGIATHQDSAAMSQRIREWLATPEGSMADLPWWGNRLFGLKHEPIGVGLQVMAEMAIVEKLPVDVRDLIVSGVRVEPTTEIDRIVVAISFNGGSFQGDVAL